MEVLSNLFELAIVAFPLYLLYDLQMRTSSKVQIFMGFAARLLSVFRLIESSTFDNERHQSVNLEVTNPSFRLEFYQLHFCASSASITLYRSVTRPFFTTSPRKYSSKPNNASILAYAHYQARPSFLRHSILAFWLVPHTPMEKGRS